MCIIFRSFVGITHVSVGDAVHLAIFKECFSELVGEIMREGDDFIHIFFGDNFCMLADSTEIFKRTLLLKGGEIANDVYI